MSKWLCDKKLQTEGSRESNFRRIWTLSSKIVILTIVTRTGPDYYGLVRIFGFEFSSPNFFGSVHGLFFLVRIFIFWPEPLAGPKKSEHSAYSKMLTTDLSKKCDRKIWTGRERTTILTIKLTINFHWVNNWNFSRPTRLVVNFQ